MWLQAVELKAHLNRLALILAMVLLVATSVILIFGEARILRFFTESSWVTQHQAAIKILSDYAILYPFYALFVLLWIAGWRLRDRTLVMLASGYCIAQLAGALITVRLMKMLFGRARPTAGEAPGTGLEWLGPTWDAAFHSFPSGHTADLFTSAIFTAALIQRGWASVLLFSLAGFVGLTRLLLAKHYPFDVVGGAVVGGLVSLAVLRWYVLPRLPAASSGSHAS